MYQILNRVFECIQCENACREKEICVFSEHELRDVIRVVSRIFKKTIDETVEIRYRLFKKINEEIAVWATLETLGLGDLAEFFVDREVEDVVLIPGRPIYIATRHGKKRSDKYSTTNMISSLLKIAYAKGIELSTSNPSFRFGLKFGNYRLRISIDLPPVVPLPQAYIRIHREKIRLPQLLADGFLTRSQLGEIAKYVKEGRHIVISGPPGSGKTTLLSVIDDLIPAELQRVYIDEADEFEDDEDKNQIKIRNVDKVREIYVSLNRNIDVVIIGELQYEEHFRAFRTSLEIGIQTLATMHSTNVKDAIRRLEKYAELRNVAIIQLEKKYEKGVRRRVVEIYAQ